MRERQMISSLGRRSLGPPMCSDSQAKPEPAPNDRPPVRCMLTAELRLEEEAEYQSQLVQLLVWTLSSIVLVLVVRIQFKVLAYREQAPGVDCGVTPFAVLALVKGFHAGIGCGVIGVNREPVFDLQTVAIAPREFTTLPIEICTVSVGDQESRLQRKVKGCNWLDAVFCRLVRRRQIAVANRKHQRPGLGVVQIEPCDFL